MLADVGFHLIPFVIIIANFLTKAANRENTFQEFYICHGLLQGGLVFERLFVKNVV
jgi:hypothetical protein